MSSTDVRKKAMLQALEQSLGVKRNGITMNKQ